MALLHSFVRGSLQKFQFLSTRIFQIHNELEASLKEILLSPFLPKYPDATEDPHKDFRPAGLTCFERMSRKENDVHEYVKKYMKAYN